ncbi:MAG: pilus assembly protein PilP [Hydrogenophilus sp.]|nr:pilus assembly protein PilP [Hydrogenophilus sp.]
MNRGGVRWGWPVWTVWLTTGCFPIPSADTSDLAAWMSEAASQLTPRVDPLPEVQDTPRAVYSAEEWLSPFDRARIFPPPTTGVEPSGTNAPDLSRPREPLEAFAFEDLQLKGLIQKGDSAWALIAAPDGRLYRVTVGNYLGRDFGRIVALEEVRTPSGKKSPRVRVVERLRDESGHWRERERIMGGMGAEQGE